MKLRVQREAGGIETITVYGRLETVGGRDLNRLRDASGREYFFTADGYYDGAGDAQPRNGH